MSTTPTPALPSASFGGGLRAFARGASFIVTTPALWLAAAAPIAAWLVMFAMVGGGAAHFVMRGINENMTLTETIERVLGALAGFIGAFLAATALAQPLAGPALDVLVERRRAALGLPVGPKQRLRDTLPRALGVTMLGLAVSLPLLALLWLASMLVPVLSPVFVILKFVVLALTVAWDFLDYPFGVEGMRLGERIAFMRAHFGLVLGFGVAAALVLLVPCVGLVVLPMGVVGATDALFFGRTAVSRYPPTS